MSIFQAVKERLRIVDVIGEYTNLKRAGNYFKAHCPFHHERTASFTVTPDKEIFYCFGCRAGGDVVEFITQMEKCTPREAIAHLVERYKLSIPDEEIGRQQSEFLSAQRRHSDLCTTLALWCQEQLKSFPRAQAYLKARGVSQASIERFSIGYFPGGDLYRRRLMMLLQKKGFLIDDLVDMRFFLKNDQRVSSFYCPFEDRIIFPIRDHLGRVCGFGGRVFLEQDDRPKYYNSHDHAGFAKGSLLFGFDVAKRDIQKKETVYVVEGYLDAIIMAQVGITHVVATLGTACTDEHLRVLSRYINRIIVMYDGDAAGVTATLRLGEMCWELALELHVVVLPEGQDPADFFLKNGMNAELVHQDIFSFYVHLLRLQFHGDQPLAERLAQLRDILKRVSRVSNPLTRDMLVQQIARVCSLPVTTLMREITPAARPSTGTEKAVEGVRRREPALIDTFAGRAFCIALQGGRLLAHGEEELIEACLPERLQLLFRRFVAFKKERVECQFSDFFGTLATEDQEYVQCIFALYGPRISDGGVLPRQALDEIVGRCRTKQWKQRIQQLQKDIVIAERDRDYDRLQQLLQEFNAIKQSL